MLKMTVKLVLAMLVKTHFKSILRPLEELDLFLFLHEWMELQKDAM